MSNQPDKPIYLIPPNDPLIARWKPAFDLFNKDNMHTFKLDVAPDVVDSMQVGLMQELIVALQHFPHLIEKFLFCVEYKFAQIAHSELYYQELDWKTDKKYYRWFCKMGTFPLTIFFLNDSDTRIYCLAGDIMADEKVSVQHEKGKKTALIGFEGDQIRIMSERLFTACWMFHLYCHGTGYNPRTYIEAILADYDLPITYEQVRKKYKEDVKKGIKLRVVPEE